MTGEKKQNLDLIGGTTNYVFGKLYFDEYHSMKTIPAKAAIIEFRARYDRIMEQLNVTSNDVIPLVYRMSDAKDTLDKIEAMVNDRSLFDANELLRLHGILKTEHELIQEIIDDYKE